MSLNFVWRLLVRWRETGRVDPKPHGGGQPLRVQGEHLETLRAVSEKHNNATLPELRVLFVERTGVEVSEATISRALTRLGITRKKISYHASERDDNEEIDRKREAFLQGAARPGALDHYVFVDETGVNLGMARTYGRAPVGQRVPGAKPANRGGNYSLIGAMGPDGVTAALVVEGAVDTLVFETFVERVLAPTLNPGDKV